MTNDFCLGSDFGNFYVFEHVINKINKCLLVNQVKQTKESIRQYEGDNIFKNYLNKPPIVQIFYFWSRKK